MKAAVYHRYGPPEVIRVEEVEKPVPKGNEVLVKVRAASVNPVDWHGLRGKPFIMRLGGLRKPKNVRLGCDVVGEVETVGASASQLKPGDRVFGGGLGLGAFAEYVCAPESTFAVKPDNVSFEEAASAPVAAFTALQGLRDKGKIQSGQRVLVNGASGGVGTFAVQIAKVFGADVTGVCSTRNLDMVRSIGADHAIDYMREDFTRGNRKYDLVLRGKPSTIRIPACCKAKGNLRDCGWAGRSVAGATGSFCDGLSGITIREPETDSVCRESEPRRPLPDWRAHGERQDPSGDR